jgi:hypothetical protein
VPCRLTRPPYSGQRRWTSNCLGSLDKIYLDAMELEISGGRCGESNAAGGARKGCMVMGGTIMHLNFPHQWATHGTPLQATIGGGGQEPTACTICELLLTGFTPPPALGNSCLGGRASPLSHPGLPSCSLPRLFGARPALLAPAMAR